MWSPPARANVTKGQKFVVGVRPAGPITEVQMLVDEVLGAKTSDQDPTGFSIGSYPLATR